jgi:Putative transposase/Transposase zinc-binding domain
MAALSRDVVQDLAFEYIPRKPETTALYGVVAEQLETFLARQQARDRPVPKFVEDEFRSFLDCGILARGFLRLRCESCGHERFLPFSCRKRGWCPSCCGRRMADTAAYLVDHVIPVVPVRQWVLSLPFALRYRLAYDSRLMGDVLNVFIRVVFGDMRRRARESLGLKSSQCGAVTFVQRFGDALNCNLHFHVLLLDGVYAAGADGSPEFHELPDLEDSAVLRVATLAARRIESVMERRSLGENADPEESDPLARDEPGLAALYASSVRSRVASGPNAGNRVVTLGDQVDGDSMDSLQSPRCATVSGFSVHANVRIAAHDRMRLERLIRYAARPAVSSERLSELPDGRLLYRLKRRWRNGTTDVVFERLDFVAKLAALVPAPRAHLVRYNGVLAPAAKWRPRIVPSPNPDSPCLCTQSPLSTESMSDPAEPQISGSGPPLQRKNYSWSQLLMRVFEIDVLECERCRGRVRILAAIQPPETTRKILDHLGLPSRPPPLASVAPEIDVYPDYS